MAYFQYGTNEQSQRVQPPSRAPADMENDLESGACAMAKAFYEKYGYEASQISDRRQLGTFFAAKQHLLLQDQELYAACTKNGREDARRHWSQVLFSLCRHGKVLKVRDGGSWIEWTNNTGTSAEVFEIAQALANDPALLEEMKIKLQEMEAPRVKADKVVEAYDAAITAAKDVVEGWNNYGVNTDGAEPRQGNPGESN